MRGKSCMPKPLATLKGAASMRPAHYAREVHGGLPLDSAGARASMRPAHYAREVFDPPASVEASRALQ